MNGRASLSLRPLFENRSGGAGDAKVLLHFLKKLR
jgi:hypothetical protein